MNFATLACYGPDSLTFLQGQLSCDLRTVEPDKLSLSCYCNHKGRVMAAPYLYAVPEGFHLILPADLAPTLLQSLSKVIVFSKAQIEDITDRLPAIPVLEGAQFEVCPGAGFTLGQANAAPEDAWLAHLIQHKIPLITQEQSGHFLPHDLRMVDLGAVSFTKGCYLGQEIIARMHYKAKLTKHLTLVEGDNLPPGETVNQVIFQGKRFTLLICDEKNHVHE